LIYGSDDRRDLFDVDDPLLAHVASENSLADTFSGSSGSGVFDETGSARRRARARRGNFERDEARRCMLARRVSRSATRMRVRESACVARAACLPTELR
jgi:hypothetical protein